MHNMVEEGIMEHAAFRKTLSEIGFAEVWITPPMDMLWDTSTGVNEALFTALSDLADVSGYGNIRIQLKNFRPGYTAYKEILRGGFPSLCRQALASVATICLNQAARQYGDAVIAGISIVQRVMMFAGSALIGLGQGFQPVCGFNYGAGLYHRVKNAFWFCVKLSFGGLFALAVLGFYFAPDIIALFRRDDPEVIRVGALSLRLQCVMFPLMSWVVLNNMLLQTIGKAFRASLLALARQGLFLLPTLFILEPLLGVLGIQMSQPLSDLATFILSLPIGIGVLREMNKPEGAKPYEPNEFSEVIDDMQ